MKTTMPITKAKIQNHFHYQVWKYLLLAVACFFLWNLLYTSTSYRSPEDKKIEFYVDGYETEETSANMNAMLERIHAQVMPEMEEVTYTMMTVDETYGSMQLMVWVAAGQGDVYLLLQDRFQSLAANGALLDLQPHVDSGALDVQGLSLSAGHVRNESGQRVLYGIPTDALRGLGDIIGLVDGSVLCVLGNSGNEEYAIRFLNDLLVQLGDRGTN